MSDVLVQFDEPQPAADGRLFIAQVNGQMISNGLWEAWIEFYPHEGGEPFRTSRETEQLTRGDLRFWAAGLTRAYLQGALMRTLSPARTAIPPSIRIPEFDAADEPYWTDENVVMDADLLHSATPPLDPVEIYRTGGEYRLRQELRALDAKQLRDVISAYDVPEIDFYDASRTFEDALAERIVASVQHRVGSGSVRTAHTPTAEQLL